MADVRIFLTTPGAGSWTVPADCTSATIECIGGGGNGAIANSGIRGGGGGAYSKKNSLTLTPGASINYQVGGVAQDSWFQSTSVVLAKGGTNGASSVNGIGGQASAGVGDVKYSGGNGPKYGGGGAAGPYGNGGDGDYTGGVGGGGYGGAGAPSVYTNGGNGTEWSSSPAYGSGGGGTGDNVALTSGGGLYGGGGAGGRIGSHDNYGRQGLIVITYTPAVAGSSSFFQLF